MKIKAETNNQTNLQTHIKLSTVDKLQSKHELTIPQNCLTLCSFDWVPLQ
uniref:Uncharacterized protein n=1 Tax=Anopheles quadriannulatus TaxID=34691 RepID=A0A182XQM4_ANOQN